MRAHESTGEWTWGPGPRRRRSLLRPLEGSLLGRDDLTKEGTMTLTVRTLRKLESAGFDREQAEALVEVCDAAGYTPLAPTSE